ncbi:MAG: chorismate mutase, partial [Bacillota bacterium]
GDKLRAIRGAITVKNNSKDEIKKASQKLIKKILEKNNIEEEEIVSIVFTATKDLNKYYPAAAIREKSFKFVPLMCYQEMEIENSLEKCIRVMVYVNINTNLENINHVYLKKAKSLRKDLID